MPRPTTTGRSASGMADGRLPAVTEGGPRNLRDLVPLPIDRRRRRRGDDLGIRQGFLDGGVALLSSGDGDQELLGLDHLEVVVAQAVARARLECRVVTLRCVAEDGGVPLRRAGPAQCELE